MEEGVPYFRIDVVVVTMSIEIIPYAIFSFIRDDFQNSLIGFKHVAFIKKNKRNMYFKELSDKIETCLNNKTRMWVNFNDKINLIIESCIKAEHTSGEDHLQFCIGQGG